MAEQRLIDANSFDVVIAFSDDISNMTCGEAKEYMEKQKAFLNKFPTVDAVKVIRCKDCRHGKPTDKLIDGYECELINGCAMSGCWYCADGQRKDGGKDGKVD